MTGAPKATGAPERLGRSAGRLNAAELQSVDETLALIFGV
jgi:hypothetical protein